MRINPQDIIPQRVTGVIGNLQILFGWDIPTDDETPAEYFFYYHFSETRLEFNPEDVMRFDHFLVVMGRTSDPAGWVEVKIKVSDRKLESGGVMITA